MNVQFTNDRGMPTTIDPAHVCAVVGRECVDGMPRTGIHMGRPEMIIVCEEYEAVRKQIWAGKEITDWGPSNTSELPEWMYY